MKSKLLILSFILILCVSCTSTNKKLETHPTNNVNALEKFWDSLRPLRLLHGINK
ncbi:MAG: hypothetical protein ACKVHD_07615 [Alphaproteobacteria bacterium]|jgi:hypothetical protein